MVGQPGRVSVTGCQGTEARKGISGGARGAGDVLEVNVERLHIGKPSNHSRREVGGGRPVAKRDVIRVCNDAGSSPYVGFPLAEGSEEGQELSFVDGAVMFRGVEFLGGTANKLVSSQLVSLVVCGTEGVVARINVEVVGEGWVREVHGDFAAHNFLQTVEGGKFAVTPCPSWGRQCARSF